MPRCRLLILACAVVLCSACGVSAENRFEQAIQKFEEKDRENPPAEGGILFVGSSSIRFWNLDKSFPELGAINRGFGGSHISDSIHFAERIVLKYKPRTIFLYAGDNDIDSGKSVEEVVGDFETFAGIVHKNLPETQLFFIAIKPSISRWKLVDKMSEANKQIEAYCEEHDYLGYIDIFQPMLGSDGKPDPSLFIGDGLHLNAKGYELWTSIIEPHLEVVETSAN